VGFTSLNIPQITSHVPTH